MFNPSLCGFGFVVSNSNLTRFGSILFLRRRLRLSAARWPLLLLQPLLLARVFLLQLLCLLLVLLFQLLLSWFINFSLRQPLVVLLLSLLQLQTLLILLGV
jgi:hypothetical protein